MARRGVETGICQSVGDVELALADFLLEDLTYLYLVRDV